MEPLVIFGAAVGIYCGWRTIRDEARAWRKYSKKRAPVASLPVVRLVRRYCGERVQEGRQGNKSIGTYPVSDFRSYLTTTRVCS